GSTHRTLTLFQPTLDQQSRDRPTSPNIGAGIEGIAQNVAHQALREPSRPGASPGSGWRVALHHDPETTGKFGARSTVPETSRIPVEWLRQPADRDENRPYPWHPGRSRLEAS